MLPTRKELVLYTFVGLKCFLFGTIAAAAIATLVFGIGFIVYNIGLGLWALYGDVGPLVFVAPFVLLGVLYGLYELGKVGDRKDWFRDDLSKHIARDRRYRWKREKEEQDVNKKIDHIMYEQRGA